MFLKSTTLLSTLFATLLTANELKHTLSNQGFTGLINTPNAMVMQEGDIAFHFDNQFDNALREYNYEKKYSDNENYIFGAGLFPYFEIQGRLSETPGYHRDLSANIKVQLPYKHKYLPNLAFGAQDIGSAANNYGNYYAVIDKEFWFVRASLGYGYSTVDNEKRKRMDGLFGGLEVKTFEWLYLVAEDDSVEQFAGVKLFMPKSWTSAFKLNALIATNISDDYETSISVNLLFPLYENIKAYRAKTTNLYRQEVKKVQKERAKSKVTPTIPPVTIEEVSPLSLEALKEKLVSCGLENITIATQDKKIYLSYENGVFLVNDLDAIGVIIGLLNQTEYASFVLQQQRSQTDVIALSGSLKESRLFYKEPSLENKYKFIATLSKEDTIDKNMFTLKIDRANSSQKRLKVELSPVVRSFIGTEFGVFNYMLWLRTKLHLNLYKGIDITAVGDIHIHDSEIDNHRYDSFMKLYQRPSHIESIMAHANSNIVGGVNTLSVGTFEENFFGAMDQYIYNIQNHTFKLKVGYFHQVFDGDPYQEKWLGKIENRALLLAKYSYLISDYDTLLEVNAGQYWNQDIGFDLKVKRYFGDIALYVSYEQSDPYSKDSIFSEETDHFAGLGIEIPLTLRHTPLFKYGQIRGTNAWNYQVSTTVIRKDGTNNLVLSSNYNPEVAIDSENYFYNRNRLQLSYFKTHAFRFVESYEKYAK
jgi:hypothetical protein